MEYEKAFIFLLSMMPLITPAYPVNPQEAESLQSYELGDFINCLWKFRLG